MEFTVDDCRSYMLAKPGVTEETPFGPDVLVYKVLGKMFATLAFDKDEGRMNLKCDPDRAIELRDEHDAIIPGYHMNKRHWNTLMLNGSLAPSLITELINHSYDLVVKGLPARLRKTLE
ncbi:MmcQ/YjbR family DNA-binding protein [Verrucomicrobiaceae bacterium 227]